MSSSAASRPRGPDHPDRPHRHRPGPRLRRLRGRRHPRQNPRGSTSPLAASPSAAYPSTRGFPSLVPISQLRTVRNGSRTRTQTLRRTPQNRQNTASHRRTSRPKTRTATSQPRLPLKEPHPWNIEPARAGREQGRPGGHLRGRRRQGHEVLPRGTHLMLTPKEKCTHGPFSRLPPTARNLRKLDWPVVRVSLLVRLLGSGRDAAGGEPRGSPAGCDKGAPAARSSHLCPVMPELQVEAFQAQAMIAGSSGRISTGTARDHEPARAGSAA